MRGRVLGRAAMVGACLVSVAAASSAEAATAEPRKARATQLRTAWDRSPTVNNRVESLLRQMTLDEKVDMLHGELNNFYGFYNGPIERLGIPAVHDGRRSGRGAHREPRGERPGSHPAARAPRAGGHVGHRARRAVRAGRRRRGLPHGPQRPALPRRRHRPRGAGRPRVRGSRRGPAAVRDDRCRRDPGHPVAPRRRGHQALQRVHAGDQPPQRRERRGRRAGAAGDLHAPVRDRRRAGPTGVRDVRVQQGQRRVRVRERRAAQPHPQGAARLRGLGDERLRRHAQHHAGDPRRPGPGDAGQHHPADRSGHCFFCGPLLDAVRAGQVPVSRIDDAVLRILRPMFALGLFDNPPVVSALPEAEHGAFARQVAERSAVLLKNDARRSR